MDERWWERLGSWVGTAVVAEHGAVVLCPAACPDYQISQWEVAGILMPEPASGCAEAAPRVQEGGSTQGGPGRSPPRSPLLLSVLVCLWLSSSQQ